MRSRTMPETDSAMNGVLRAFYTYYPKLKPQGTIVKSPFFTIRDILAFLAVDQMKSAERIEEFYRQVKRSAVELERLNFMNPSVNI